MKSWCKETSFFFAVSLLPPVKTTSLSGPKAGKRPQNSSSEGVFLIGVGEKGRYAYKKEKITSQLPPLFQHLN